MLAGLSEAFFRVVEGVKRVRRGRWSGGLAERVEVEVFGVVLVALRFGDGL
jgi:hypothetical protein